jgi:hypothetical protein
MAEQQKAHQQGRCGGAEERVVLPKGSAGRAHSSALLVTLVQASIRRTRA